MQEEDYDEYDNENYDEDEEYDDDLYSVNDIDKIHAIDEDYLSYMNIDPTKSKQGWLLTLNDEEFQIVKDVFNDEDEYVPITLPFIVFFGRVPMAGEKFKLAEFEEVFDRFNMCVNLIDLVRNGVLKYKTGDTDNDWSYSLVDAPDNVLQSADFQK